MQLSYEDAAFLGQKRHGQEVSEMYRGKDLVVWWGSIERVVKQKIDEYSQQQGKEKELAELETFLRTWQDNRITGSVNKATVRTLSAAASQAASHDALDTSNFFSNLRDSLNAVIASVEELPTVPSSTGKPVPGGGGPMPKPATPTGQFGAQKEPPSPSGVNKGPETPKKPGDQGGAGAPQLPQPIARAPVR
jgi:hypothetical protein